MADEALTPSQLDALLAPGNRGAEDETSTKERARSGESEQRSRTSTNDMSSSRRGGQRSGTNREKGRTRDQLYNEANKLGVEGRSSMNKAQLERAVDRRK